jgi:hypothetical protein
MADIQVQIQTASTTRKHPERAGDPSAQPDATGHNIADREYGCDRNGDVQRLQCVCGSLCSYTLLALANGFESGRVPFQHYGRADADILCWWNA